MDKIKIMTDSASDITLEDAEKYGIHIIPINLTIDGKSIKDRYDITIGEFYDYLATHDEIPKTSQITVNEHLEEFKKFSDEYSIIYVPISSKGSGSFQSAVIAKNEIMEENPDADITIIDSMSYSYGYGYWVLEAAKMVQNGATKEEIISMIEEGLPSSGIILAPLTLDYLVKGGRISSTTKIIANVLDINPIMAIEDGLVTNRDKVRGKKKVISRMVDIINEEADLSSNRPIIIVHGMLPEIAQKMKEKLLEKTGFKNVITAEIGPCIGIHTGPGAYAFIYPIKKQ